MVPLFDSHMAAEDIYCTKAISISLTLVRNSPTLDREKMLLLVKENLLEKRDNNGCL